MRKINRLYAAGWCIILFLTVCAFNLFFIVSCSNKNSGASQTGQGNSYEDGVLTSGGRMCITQFGIRWHFDKEYKWGRFANGDYWVVGPVTIIGISPESREISGRTMNGSMINPSPETGNTQGYDSALTYSTELNAALNVSESNPLILANDSSLVSTISIAESGNRPQLKTAAILTVLEEPASEGSFRPPYCGTDKTIKFNTGMLNFSLLKKLQPVDGTPVLADVERFFERPWIDHIPGWSCRMIHPEDNMPDYGREIATEVGIAALMLHLDFSDEEKRILLIRFVQLGIDNYGIIQSGGTRNWAPDGGHTSGRKWPILFAGIILGDEGMKSIGGKSGSYLYTFNYPAYGPGNVPAGYIHFGEDGQTFYVTDEDVTRSHSVDWSPSDRSGTPAPFMPGDKGLAEWGIVHSTNPYVDNKDWLAIYRQCCTALAWQGFVLAARIMEDNSGAKTLWNHDALFDYQDRYMAVTADSGSNPEWRSSVAGMDSIWGTGTGWRAWDDFTENMWDTYRGMY